MRRVIAAMTLLLLAGPALASPRHPTPAQWKDIHAYSEAEAFWINHHTGVPEDESAEVRKSRADADRLEKKLTAQGFCVYGKGGVGRSSKDGKHCYTVRDPSIPSLFHQH